MHVQARGIRDILAVDVCPEMVRELETRFGPPPLLGNVPAVRAWEGDFEQLPLYQVGRQRCGAAGPCAPAFLCGEGPPTSAGRSRTHIAQGPADLVIFNAVFGNFPDLGTALLKACQLLRPGGYVCISHPLGRAWLERYRCRGPAWGWVACWRGCRGMRGAD